MKLPDLIKIANEAYNRTMPDQDLVQKYYDDPQTDHGDTLAQFIVKEVHDAYDKEAHDNMQLMGVAHVLESAAAQLMAVREAFLGQVSEDNHDYDPNCDCDHCMWWRQDRDAAFEQREHEGS